MSKRPFRRSITTARRFVASRLARDFWVRPSAMMIRVWCQTYARGCDFDRDYLPWVVETFSGVLCVDEVYQDQIALLLAVDPTAPKGGRLVGYQLVEGTVDQAALTAFLTRLKEVGIDPDEVITDGGGGSGAFAGDHGAATHSLKELG